MYKNKKEILKHFQGTQRKTQAIENHAMFLASTYLE